LKIEKFNKYKTTTDKMRRDKLFKKEDMMMVNLRRESQLKESLINNYILIGT